jgi:hypothetical protein
MDSTKCIALRLYIYFFLSFLQNIKIDSNEFFWPIYWKFPQKLNSGMKITYSRPSISLYIFTLIKMNFWKNEFLHWRQKIEFRRPPQYNLNIWPQFRRYVDITNSVEIDSGLQNKVKRTKIGRVWYYCTHLSVFNQKKSFFD